MSMFIIKPDLLLFFTCYLSARISAFSSERAYWLLNVATDSIGLITIERTEDERSYSYVDIWPSVYLNQPNKLSNPIPMSFAN